MVRGELQVNMSYDDFLAVIRTILVAADVDERWYLQRYEDIARAVAKGDVASGRRHFIDDGYFEGRQPFPIEVDEKWYLAEYPDVADAIRVGDIASAQAHFDALGYMEGRRPFSA
jgi:hypothetical protein